MGGKRKPIAIPSLEQVEQERERLKWHRQLRGAFGSVLTALIVTAAIAALVALLFLSVLQVSGDSMSPALADGDIILLVKAREYHTGDLVGLYHEGKILLKRVIGTPGDTVSIDTEGNVTVNASPLEEPYLSEKSLGICDVTFPYQVPEGAFFVLGDHRETSIDSRSTAVGPVRREKLLGKVVLRLWPLESIGPVG